MIANNTAVKGLRRNSSSWSHSVFCASEFPKIYVLETVWKIRIGVKLEPDESVNPLPPNF